MVFGVLVEVDNSGEARDARIKGLREELAPAMKQTPGFQSGVFATNARSGSASTRPCLALPSRARY